jgi:hypothetical protein
MYVSIHMLYKVFHVVFANILDKNLAIWNAVASLTVYRTGLPSINIILTINR